MRVKISHFVASKRQLRKVLCQSSIFSLEMSETPSNNYFFYLIDIVDKSVKFIELNGFYSAVLISFSAVCGTVCLSSRSFVINYIYRYAPHDKMILIEQVMNSIYLICDGNSTYLFKIKFQIPLALSYGFFSALPILSLATGQTLAQIFGEKICMPFFVAQTFHNTWMIMSNFGISLFRFTCMWDNLLIFEKDRLKCLMKEILIVEVVMTTGIVSLSKKNLFKDKLYDNFLFFIISFPWGSPHRKSLSFRFLLWIQSRIDFSHSGLQRYG